MTTGMSDIARQADAEDAAREAAYEREIARRQSLDIEHPLHLPRFPQTWCSQCGRSLGPGQHGTSHCGNHGQQP